MLRSIRYISLSLFACIYLAVSLAGLIGTLTLPAISSGPQKIASATAGAKEKPKIFWSQRRHTLAAKQAPLSGVAFIAEQQPARKERGIALPPLNRTSSYSLVHSERRSTRAPPLA